MDDIVFAIDMVRKMSTNKIYAGTFYRNRVEDKTAYYFEVRRAIHANKIKAFDTSIPVTLSFSFIFKKRPLDASNCSYMGKMIEDALVKNGILADDSSRIVSEVRYSSVKSDSVISDCIIIRIARNV